MVIGEREREKWGKGEMGERGEMGKLHQGMGLCTHFSIEKPSGISIKQVVNRLIYRTQRVS